MQAGRPLSRPIWLAMPTVVLAPAEPKFIRKPVGSIPIRLNCLRRVLSAMCVQTVFSLNDIGTLTSRSFGNFHCGVRIDGWSSVLKPLTYLIGHLRHTQQ